MAGYRGIRTTTSDVTSDCRLIDDRVVGGQLVACGYGGLESRDSTSEGLGVRRE